MESAAEFRIVTNNPLVRQCLPERYEVDYEETGYREILVKVRDLVYAGHRMYTHPLSGSVKPKETPYKTIAVSRKARGMDEMEAALISSAIETYDKFTPHRRELTEKILKDFQLVDYTLICGALDLDALSGLSNRRNF